MLPEVPPVIGSPEWNRSMSEYMMTLDALIARHGWAIHAVSPTDESRGAPYCHTVGLWAQDFPELIITGLDLERAHFLLNQVASATYANGMPIARWPLTNDAYELLALEDRSCDTKDLRLGICHQFYRGHVPVTQLIWPDQNHVYPTQPEWPHGPEAQPLCDPREPNGQV